MIQNILVIAALVLLFYLFIPGAGAFYVRNQWRRFRSTMIRSSGLPFVSYASLHGRKNGAVGDFRFIGSLEAIRGERIWLRGDNLTVTVMMDQCQVFVLPSLAAIEDESDIENNSEIFPEESPRKVSWNSIMSLPRGTRMFVSGTLFSEGNDTRFSYTKEMPLTLVIFDGDPETLLRRAIWSGRHKNEYWNQFTLPSLIVGFFSILFYTYVLYRNPLARLPVLISLSAGLLPVVIFLPPGFLGFLGYRYAWKKARILRAERDLFLLPLKSFDLPVESGADISVQLPTGESYHKRKVSGDWHSVYPLVTDSIKIRKSGVLPESGTLVPFGYHIFGTAVPVEDRVVYVRPVDPMADYVAIPDDPVQLSGICSSRARFYEYTAAAAFAAGIALNVILVFTALIAIIR